MRMFGKSRLSVIKSQLEPVVEEAQLDSHQSAGFEGKVDRCGRKDLSRKSADTCTHRLCYMKVCGVGSEPPLSI